VQSPIVQIRAAATGRPILPSIQYKRLDQFSKPGSAAGRREFYPPPDAKPRSLAAISRLRNMIDQYQLITSAIDDALNFSDTHLRGLLHTIYTIPDYMIDSSKKAPTNDWCYWKPIKSEIGPLDFDSYEYKVKIKLPHSYVTFLSYKYFIELNFGHDVTFFKHTKNWVNDNLQQIASWGFDTTIERGLLPFADMNDWGIVCFDSTKKHEDNEYDIIYLDHEDKDAPRQFKNGRFSFIDLINDMSLTLKEWRQTKINDG